MKGLAIMVVELTTLLVVGATFLLPQCTSFLLHPRSATFLRRPSPSPTLRIIASPSYSTTAKARLRRPLFVNFNSDDPFQILGMEEPTTDKKVIKRAYKRMALQYHPDVATTKDSSPEEKKLSSDRFAKINWAYDVLTGKRENDATYATASSQKSSGGTGTGSSSSWTPPHRRSAPSSYSTSSSSGRNTDSVDWTDFMPKVDEEEYDVNGDSLSKILSDLFVGAAAGAAGLGGPNVFRDFIDFLEGNVDGFGGTDDDTELRIILQTGSLDEVRNELDDTELVVQQLNAKLRGIQEEIMTLTNQAKMTTRYLEKMELEESLAELNARKGVVEGYVKRAQKRLLSLQTRYKELLTSGATSDTYTTRSSSSWQDIKNEATGTRNTPPTGSRPSTGSSTATSEPSPAAPRSTSNENDAWMNESFGSSSYSRGRGDGRRRSRSRSTSSGPSTSSSQPDATASSPPRGEAPRSQESPRYSSSSPYTSGSSPSNSSTTSSSSSALRNVATDVPPHRRTSGSYENQQEKDKRRLRELKVDEEFDKLKKELGL